jgi:hypothetical protein
MRKETPDQIGYRIAVAAIGVALIVALAGLCVIIAVGEGTDIPKEMWTTVSALGGGLLGLLAPSPTPTRKALAEEESMKNKGGNQAPGNQAPGNQAPGDQVPKWGGLQKVLKPLSLNLSVVILLAVFLLAVGLSLFDDSTQLQALAAASGAALIGLLAPSPIDSSDPAGPRQPPPGAKPHGPV